MTYPRPLLCQLCISYRLVVAAIAMTNRFPSQLRGSINAESWFPLHTYIPAYIHAYHSIAYIHTYFLHRTHICTYAYIVHIYIFQYMYIYSHTYIHTYIHIYVIHTYIRQCSSWWWSHCWLSFLWYLCTASTMTSNLCPFSSMVSIWEWICMYVCMYVCMWRYGSLNNRAHIHQLPQPSAVHAHR